MRTNTTIAAYAFAMLVSFTICFSPAKAQQKNDLQYGTRGFGILNKSYFLNNEKISKRHVGQLLEKENKEAYTAFKSGRINATVGFIIYMASATVFIYEGFAIILSGFDRSATLFVVSIAGMASGVILALSANGKFRKAATIYNRKTSTTRNTYLQLGITQSGRVGLSLSF